MPTNYPQNLRFATDDKGGILVAPSTAETIANSAVTVTDSATLIIAARTGRKALIILNNSAGDVYIGGTGVTTTNGFKLTTGQSFSDYATGAAWYGIVASSTANMRVIEVY